MKYLEQFDVPIISNVAGTKIEDYAAVAEKISQAANVSILELNISCPTLRRGYSVWHGSKTALELTRAVKDVSQKPVYVKLSPNVTNIVEMAKECC